MNLLTASKKFALRASDASFETRFDWASSGHSEAEVGTIWDEVVAKVPAEATKVLEIGSGLGGFYQKLIAARPGIGYLGIDLTPQNVADARTLVGGDPALFEISTVWDTLAREDADWDFVVSVHAAFSYTHARYNPLLLRLLDAKAPKGFVVVYEPTNFPAKSLSFGMAEVLANSTNTSESYFEGARDFLADPLLKGLHPFYVHREGTTTEVPQIPTKLCRLRTGAFNRVLERTHWKKEVRILENAEPTDFVGVDVSNGRVTGTSTKSLDLDEEVVSRLRKFGA